MGINLPADFVRALNLKPGTELVATLSGRKIVLEIASDFELKRKES